MKNHIKILTLFGLIAIMALQSIWLYSTYSMVRTEVKEKSELVFKDAIILEMFLRMDSIKRQLPDSARVISEEVTMKSDSSDMTNVMISAVSMTVQDALQKQYGSCPSLVTLDSIYSLMLVDANMNAHTVCNLTDSLGNVLQCSDKEFSPGWGTVSTTVISISEDKSRGLQAIMINPYWVIFQRMLLLLIATVLIVIMVVYCILYQIKIINRQNKIAKLREDFSYAMIHDMKTPLSSILMGTQILESGKLDAYPEKRARYFHILKDEGEHLLSLTNKVLTLSKLESHQLNISKEAFSLRLILDDLIDKFTAKAEKRVTFTLHLAEESAFGDKEFLKEAISNLIDNAIKYSVESVDIVISSVMSMDKFLLIKVKDNGMGIPFREQSRIFEKYERASAMERSRNGGAPGFGLGLSYVFHVTEAHGGSVKVESIEGEYSEFTISIPCHHIDFTGDEADKKGGKVS